MARTTSTRTRKATAAKEATAKPAARKTASRKTPPAARAKKTATAEQPALPPAKPRRHTPSSEFLTEAQIHGHYTARLVGINTLHIRGWRAHADGTASHPLTDGTLHYDHGTRTLTWQAICRMGAWHAYPIVSRSTATQARIDAAQCEAPHHDFSGVKPLTETEWAALGIRRTPTWAKDLTGTTETLTITVPAPAAAPQPEPAPRALGDQFTRSHADTTDTQPMNTREIADHIARADNDLDTAKEHPQP